MIFKNKSYFSFFYINIQYIRFLRHINIFLLTWFFLQKNSRHQKMPATPTIQVMPQLVYYPFPLSRL